jgi:hypothetical protein
MAICSTCGGESPPGSRECKWCGLLLLSEEEFLNMELVTPECGRLKIRFKYINAKGFDKQDVWNCFRLFWRDIEVNTVLGNNLSQLHELGNRPKDTVELYALSYMEHSISAFLEEKFGQNTVEIEFRVMEREQYREQIAGKDILVWGFLRITRESRNIDEEELQHALSREWLIIEKSPTMSFLKSQERRVAVGCRWPIVLCGTDKDGELLASRVNTRFKTSAIRVEFWDSGYDLAFIDILWSPEIIGEDSFEEVVKKCHARKLKTW